MFRQRIGHQKLGRLPDFEGKRTNIPGDLDSKNTVEIPKKRCGKKWFWRFPAQRPQFWAHQRKRRHLRCAALMGEKMAGRGSPDSLFPKHNKPCSGIVVPQNKLWYHRNKIVWLEINYGTPKIKLSFQRTQSSKTNT